MQNRRKIIAGIILKSFLKWTALVLAGLVMLLSITPYLIPLQEGGWDRYALTYSNSEFVKAGNVEIHYREWGHEYAHENGAGKNVLLVHGLGGSTFSWRYTAPALAAEGYRVIAVDLPGFGASERKTGFEHSAENRASYLWEMLEKLYPGESWHLAGHSMGGAAVAAMALQEPHKTDAIILAAGAISPFEPSLINVLLKYPPLTRWARVLAGTFIPQESRIETLLESAYGREPSPEEVYGYLRPLRVEGTDGTFADLLRSTPTPLADRLDQVEKPALCLWGENDEWVSLEEGRKLDGLLPDSELVVIPGEGHCPMETAPEKFNQKLLAFLNRR